MNVLIKLIIRRIIRIIGYIGLVWFLVPAIFTAHFHIGVYTGIVCSLILIVYGTWGGWIKLLIHTIWQKVAGKIVLSILAAICAAIIGLAVACMIAMGSANAARPQPGGTVMVLGCKVYKSGPSKMLVTRLKAAKAYLDENPESKCIVCGGQGKDEPVPECDSMFDYLVAAGIAPERIYKEGESTDTVENLSFAKEIMEREGLPEQTVIVSNKYHMYRALKYAEEAGLSAEGLGAQSVWWLFPSNYVREMYGILEMWILK